MCIQHIYLYTYINTLVLHNTNVIHSFIHFQAVSPVRGHECDNNVKFVLKCNAFFWYVLHCALSQR